MKIFFLLIVCALLLLRCGNNNATQEVIEKYPDGEIKLKYVLKNGKIEGVRNEYYKNGNLKSVENWHDSLLSGVSKYYYPNGEIEEERAYTKGRPSGCWYSYYRNKRLKSFHEYWFLDSVPLLSVAPNRYLFFDSLGNPDFNKIGLYYETKVVQEDKKNYLKIDAYYVPLDTKCRIIFQSGKNYKLDTLEGEGYEHFMLPLESSTDYIKGDFQFYEEIDIKGERVIRTFNSYFDSRTPACNIEAWPKKDSIR